MFVSEIYREDWLKLTEEDQIDLLQKMVNLDEGIGFPVIFQHQTYLHPNDLLTELKSYFLQGVTKAVIHSIHSEDSILLESFVLERNLVAESFRRLMESRSRYRRPKLLSTNPWKFSILMPNTSLRQPEKEFQWMLV